MSFYFECITGRLQFTMGAWGMADEAVPTYIGLIDSHTLGLRFLKQEFGECGVPRTAWQLDSFGHSREFAYLFAMVCSAAPLCFSTSTTQLSDPKLDLDY